MTELNKANCESEPEDNLSQVSISCLFNTQQIIPSSSSSLSSSIISSSSSSSSSSPFQSPSRNIIQKLKPTKEKEYEKYDKVYANAFKLNRKLKRDLSSYSMLGAENKKFKEDIESDENIECDFDFECFESVMNIELNESEGNLDKMDVVEDLINNFELNKLKL
jgi:hypothetical protein